MSVNRMVKLFVAMLVALGLAVGAGVASAASYVDYDTYEYLSTNDRNRDLGWSHVNLVGQGPGTVTLEFVQPRNFIAYFEYRIDGEVSTTFPHPLFGFTEPFYAGVGVGPGYPPVGPPQVRTFTAESTVEIRLAAGAENRERFDWITFPVGPQTKDDCKQGGWQNYGFENQGQCIKFVNTR
jgi:hypothetical protein